MVKDHSDSDRGNPLLPLNAPSHRGDITYHGICYISRGAPVGTRNSSTMRDRSNGPSHHELMLYHGDILKNCKMKKNNYL